VILRQVSQPVDYGKFFDGPRPCIVEFEYVLQDVLRKQGLMLPMKTKSRSRLNGEGDLICALSSIGSRITLLSNKNRLSLRIYCSARCIIKCCLSLFLFLLYACAAVVTLEKLYSQWAMDPLFVY